MVVYAGGNFYLASAEEMMYSVTLEDGSELCDLLKKDVAAGKDIDVGIPAKYMGNSGGP